jgi:chromate transporter
LALSGVVVCMAGILLPSTTLTFFTTRWAHRNRDLLGVKAFKAGMAPIVIALLISTGWLLSATHDDFTHDWRLWLLTAATTWVVWRTKTHMLWLLGLGALLGGLGWV